MKFVKAAPNSSGAYQGPRSVPFPGCLPLTDGQAEALDERIDAFNEAAGVLKSL